MKGQETKRLIEDLKATLYAFSTDFDVEYTEEEKARVENLPDSFGEYSVTKGAWHIEARNGDHSNWRLSFNGHIACSCDDGKNIEWHSPDFPYATYDLGEQETLTIVQKYEVLEAITKANEKLRSEDLERRKEFEAEKRCQDEERKKEGRYTQKFVEECKKSLQRTDGKIDRQALEELREKLGLSEKETEALEQEALKEIAITDDTVSLLVKFFKERAGEDLCWIADEQAMKDMLEILDVAEYGLTMDATTGKFTLHDNQTGEATEASPSGLMHKAYDITLQWENNGIVPRDENHFVGRFQEFYEYGDKASLSLRQLYEANKENERSIPKIGSKPGKAVFLDAAYIEKTSNDGEDYYDLYADGLAATDGESVTFIGYDEDGAMVFRNDNDEENHPIFTLTEDEFNMATAARSMEEPSEKQTQEREPENSVNEKMSEQEETPLGKAVNLMNRTLEEKRAKGQSMDTDEALKVFANVIKRMPEKEQKAAMKELSELGCCKNENTFRKAVSSFAGINSKPERKRQKSRSDGGGMGM